MEIIKTANVSRATNHKGLHSKESTVDKESITLKKSFALSTSQLIEDDTKTGSKGSISFMELGAVYGNNQVKEWLDIYGVRIRPAVVRFFNTFENQNYSEPVSVQNISGSSVTVRILTPRALSFRITPLERGHQLAPGLKVDRRIHYICTKSSIVHSSLPIYINDNIVQLPLEATKGQAFVDIFPTFIKFGRVDIGCKPVEKRIHIKNVSFCATKFLVDIGNNELGLHVSPMKGWIRPHSSVSVAVKLLALKEGIRSSEIWITTDLCQMRISVEVEACHRNLLVSHPNTINEFTLVDFPVTFYGCRRYQTLVVHNMAASSSAFVVLADHGCNGQEPFRAAKERGEPHVKMFDIEPVEGRIKPFEGRIFTFWFNPKMIEDSEHTVWKNDKNRNMDLNDYLCAVRIKRIQVDESNLNGSNHQENIDLRKDRRGSVISTRNDPSDYNLKLLMEKEVEEGAEFSSKSLVEDISALFYVYGEAETPSLSVIPDALYFPDTPVGTTVVKVVQLTNNTNQVLAFQYIKIPFFEVIPNFKKLNSNTSYDVTVKLCARNLGFLPKSLTFEILAEENATDKQDLQVVNHVTVRICGTIRQQKIIIKPKFNPGITPLITHEVGFLTDEVTFVNKIEKPRCALTIKAKLGRPWHWTDATIAFPNDRPLTLRPRPVDAKAKTIYKGLPRYIPPVNESETYTMEKLIKKKAHDDWFLNYIRGTAASSLSKDCCCNKKFPEVPLDHPVTIVQKEVKHPCEVLVPLTFVQLYRIRVNPELVSFGSVTKNKSCSQLLTITNDNEFKISAKMVPLTLGIEIQTLEYFIVSGKSEAEIMLTFKRESLGRYSGTVTCIINGFHSFDILVVAEVVHRSLTASPLYVQVKIPDIPFADLCVPVAISNPLNIPVAFSWDIPGESPIKIEPVFGVAPKLGTVWCGVFFEPDSPNYKLYPLTLMVEGSICLQLKTGVILPKTNVYFLKPILDIGYIPINLMTVRQFMVFNPDFSDAMFVILNEEPFKGVRVKPSSGTIKAKSCLSLALHITVSIETTLDFTVFMTLQNSTTIEMRINGFVVYPEVEVTPKKINLHRVPCNSVNRTSLTAENKSKAKVEVGFKMDEYPQFKVSLSKKHNDPGLSSCGFTLDPGASLKFYLHFIPMDLASYEFYLPFIINSLLLCSGITNKDSEGQRRTIKGADKSVPLGVLVLVNVVVIKPSLVFSNLELFFSSVSETKSFSIKNTSEKAIFTFTRSENLQGLFDIRVDENDADKNRSSLRFSELLPEDSITYIVKFIGNCPGLYIRDVDIMTSFEDYSCLYNTVRLTVKIDLPSVITSLEKEMYFQPVPLNVEISYTLHLQISTNKHSKEVIISFETTAPHKDLFSIHYPKGNKVVGITGCTIPIQITFFSSYPVALRKPITFKDGEHSKCTIMMVATADNCLLTTYIFLKSQAPLQPKMDVLDETSIVHEGVENEKNIHPKQNLMNKTAAPRVDSSLDSSELSTLSTKTICSPAVSCKTKDSLTYTQSIKHSVIVGKEQRFVSNSDIDMSFQLHENVLSNKKSMTNKITPKNEEIVFPMFPLEVTVSEQVIFMNVTLNSVQQWAYEQVFCCSYNPLFGSYSFSSIDVVNKSDYGITSCVALKNVFDALERICGRRVRRYFTPIEKIPEEKTAKALFTYNLYQQLVDFMEAQGALMAHVEPKYLMVYDEYCYYQMCTLTSKVSHNNLTNDSQLHDSEYATELISTEKFLSISVQCWLDLFLQIYKTLVLGPAVGVSYFPVDNVSKPTFLHNVGTDINFYGRSEEVLLAWLTHQYNSQRTTVWPNKPPPPRTVTNFDTDLEDGLVLTATTAAYCPYLTQIYFGDMCLYPSTTSQAYHNTTCLCMAWVSIRIGFSVTPRDFVNANSIKMLLLVTHLYKILPSYKPEETITFRAILNAVESYIVALENNEEHNVTYHVEILPHSSNFILEDCQNSFVLKRKSKGKVTVKYIARNTNKVEAILLLCGACMPPKFGRNYVFRLEGYPVELPVFLSFNIVSPLNTPMDTHITVDSPHMLDFKANEYYSYDLWVSYTEPQPGNINGVSWAKERKHKVPRHLYFTDNTLVVKSNKKKVGSGILAFKVCCFSNVVRDYWLIFRNPEIGDFIVKLRLTPLKTEPTLSLQLELNQDSKCSCISERMHSCSRTATVQVPCCNLNQWSAIRVMFELTTSLEEKEFWANYIESNIGFQLLKWILQEKKEKLNKELELLLKKSKTYKITCPSQYVSCAPTLHVPDVRSKSYVPLEIHLDEKTPSHMTVLNMTSTDGVEMRTYNLKIVIEK